MSTAQADSDLRGLVGSLALSQVRSHSVTSSLRAVHWQQALHRLGIVLPLFVVHDLGMTLTAGSDQMSIEPRCPAVENALDPAFRQHLQHYRTFMAEARASETARRANQLQLSDDLVTVLLAKLLKRTSEACTHEPSYEASKPPPSSMLETVNQDELVAMYHSTPRSFENDVLVQLEKQSLFILTLIDALDLDTLQLFGLLGTAQGGSLAQVELLSVLETPEANDIVNFSLEILPSVLETKPEPGVGTVAGQGYSGVGNRGDLDNLVLTELAWDDAELMRRLVDKEVLFYARDQQREEQGREHWLLIDASASMRGDRSTFARAIAMATAKKLLLEGESIAFRFFDSRLYEKQLAKGQELPTAQLLSFKGERGRNPSRVIKELLTLTRLRGNETPPILHLFTHAAFYAPRNLIEQLTQQCQVAAVFMLPSGGELNLNYIDLLKMHWVVDHETLGQGKRRAEAARDILADVHADLDAPGSQRSGAMEVL